MSGLFLLEAKESDLWVKVRANCLLCARELAARHAQNEGTLLWRSPELSTVTLVHEPLHSDESPRFLERGGLASV